MAQGLQCWDAQGRIAVDLTDYNLRYMGSFSVAFAAGDSSKNVAFSGATLSGTLGVIISSSSSNANEFFCRAYNGGLTVTYLPTGGTYATTISVEVYSFE